jgi:hypothetical protein
MVTLDNERISHKRLLIVAGAILLAPFWGCGNFLERPTPSKDEYIQSYLEYFDGSQIEKLDYTYRGAIGGASTVGRAQFKGPVKLRKIMVDARIKSGLVIKEGTYDPAEMTKEPAAMQFRHEWENHAGGSLPPWFDFPFNRKMRTLTEASEGSRSPTNPRPRYEKLWYIDDEHNVVYVRANWG